jgi:hypothetical protein
MGSGVQRPVLFADEDVACIGALRNGGEDEPRVELGGQVLERVDGEVDAALGERVFDLLDEDSLAVRRRGERWERSCFGPIGVLGHAVAGGADDLDHDLTAAVVQPGGDVIGLPEGELGASRADTDGFCHLWIKDTGLVWRRFLVPDDSGFIPS